MAPHYQKTPLESMPNIDSGATTASQLAMSVAEHSINATNLDLVGLAQNGVEYVLSV